MRATKSISKPLREKFSTASGFALVITLLLMVLLVVIAVGLLGLSSISLRTSGRSNEQAQARTNARVALMLAIGELQKHTGPDTRITAPADMVEANAPQLVGAWKSWEGSDHQSTGRPIPPGYNGKSTPSNSGGRFLSWLVSGATAGGSPTSPSSLAFTSASGDTVPLLSTGTVKQDDTRQIHLVPQKINGGGRIAWWVSGENQKARLPQPYKPISDNVAHWSELAKSHAVPDPEPFGLEALLTDPAEFIPDPANIKPVAKAITRDSASFLVADAADPKPRQFFHDLSVSSVGLLTNTATGGWRKDFSIFTENWDSIVANLASGETLPLFRYTPNPGNVSQSNIPTPIDPKAAGSQLYPWGQFVGSFPAGSPAHDHNGAVNSWRNLVDYATFYRKYDVGADGGKTIALLWPNLPDLDDKSKATANNYLHRIRPIPVIARFHWVYSLKTVLIPEPVPAPVPPNPPSYRLQLLLAPVFTLWNPYNVSISVPNLTIDLKKSPPCLIRFYKPDGTPLPFKRLIKGAALGSGNNKVYDTATTPAIFNGEFLRYKVNAPITLGPGQTRVYSANDQSTSNTVTMTPGLTPDPTTGLGGLNGGHLATIDDDTDIDPSIPADGVSKLAFGPDDTIKASLGFTYEMNHSATEKGKGVRLEVFGNNNRLQMFYLMSFKMSDADADLYWPPIPPEDLAQYTAAELSGTPGTPVPPKPFFSTVFGSRVVSDSTLPGKGFLQSNPLTAYSNGTQNVGSFPGSAHPVNSALDYSFIAHPAGGDSRLPNAGPEPGHVGYIITGFGSSDGLSRVIINDFPLRPVTSVGQLQNWDMRSQNSRPPFQLNVIGNSDASPLIAKNAAHRSIHQHDDSYCANHLLFDDWFVSSIAPNPANFGAAGDDMRTHYVKYLKGEASLANRDYRPIAEDRMLSETAANGRADDILGSKDGWRRVASRLEVEGMFNVNSTSVTAWRALLGHCRGQKIPHLASTGMTTSTATDYAVSRFPVAGDARAGGPGFSGAFDGSSEFTGYRVFTDEMLDALAANIVAQVRLRGPFLSLSEFVNRQLVSNDDELALAGAIQTALNQLSDGTANDPHKALKALSIATDPSPPGDEMYLFPQAAEGFSSYGMPGWIRQADILSPLAPILTARDDTFTIRAYGDARDKDGKVLARAWCEATVRRTRNFMDPADAPETTDAPTNGTNIAFGRRYGITGFRWLSPDEI